MRKIIKFLSFSLCICFLITAFPEKLIDTVNSRVKRVKIDGKNEIKEFDILH